MTARGSRALRLGQISGSARIFMPSLYPSSLITLESLCGRSPHSGRFAGFGGQTELIHL